MKLWSSECQRKRKDTDSVYGKMKPKILSLFDLTAIGVGSSLGFGISVLIGEVIKNVAGPAILVSVILAGVTALTGGFCSAEFGVRFLKADSAYAYSYFWSRENVAFIYGWALILVYIAGTASAAKGIIIFADALSEYKISDFLKNTTSTDFPDVFPHFDFLSMGIVAVITIIIAFGMKDSLVVKKLFTICNVALIVTVIVAGAFKADSRNWKTEGGSEGKPIGGFAPFGVLGIIKGAAITFYGFIGFDTVSVSGEEIQKRKRNLPLAVLVTTLVTLGAYIGVGVILTLMVLYDKLSPHAAVPSAFQQVGWISFKWIAAVGSFFGFQTGIFGAIFPLPRVIRAMANDGLLFSFLGYGHTKFKTPLTASVIGGLIAAGLAGIFPFQKLVYSTVIGALFVYIILAINVILLRYSPKPEDNEKLSESWKNLINKNVDISMKAAIRNYFNFKEKYPTNLTKKIITGNVILFCISSIGLSVIFNVFYDALTKCATEAVIPASILLTVMIFNLISITCQPKSQEFVPFKVPLIPIVPCLSIFLNIFLMITFESLTWILFSSWMCIGIFLHIFQRFKKYVKGETDKNSLYKINKTNAVKLNESIWKIKSDKKFFYEGAVNPVYSGDIEGKTTELKDSEVQKQNDKTSFQLKQAEIIQTAESVVEEKAEPLDSELELNFIRVNNAKIVDNVMQEEEKVQWECVAEIHTEEECSQESVVLEIVDNTYNFLNEVNSKGTCEETASFEGQSVDELRISENSDFKEAESLQPDPQQVQKEYNEHIGFNCLEKNKQESFKKELLSKIELRMTNMNYKETDSKDGYLNDSENIRETISDENRKDTLKENSSEDEFSKESATAGLVSVSFLEETSQNKKEYINLIVENYYEAHKSEMILIQNNTNSVGVSDSKSAKSVLDERGRIKEFKEKLNQLLKNQINSDATLTKNFSLAQSGNVDDAEKSNEKNNNSFYNSFKTLNKSQIKDKLELLLAKGPPKRLSLESSFNIKIKETDKVNEFEKEKDEILSVQTNNTLNGSENEKNFEKSSVTLPDSEKTKGLFLKELPNDVCC